MNLPKFIACFTLRLNSWYYKANVDYTIVKSISKPLAEHDKKNATHTPRFTNFYWYICKLAAIKVVLM